MNYVEFEVNNKVYKLRLGTRAVVALEKNLGCNPLSIFGDGDTVPTITSLVAILHASLQQFNHGVSMNDAFDIFDDYLAEGKTALDFIPVVIELYQASGLIPKNTEEAKNA